MDVEQSRAEQRSAATPHMTQHGGQLRPGVRRWTTLSHGGVVFPPPYVPHGIGVGWRGRAVVLPPAAEEFATLYAEVLERRDIEPAPMYRANFWADWSRMLPPGCPIRTLDGCNFDAIRIHVRRMHQVGLTRKTQGNHRPPTPTAVVDGVEQPVAGWLVERPGIFAGRGDANPLTGRIRKRLAPCDVTLNLGPGARAPPLRKGQRWRAIVHDPFVDWLAAWRDPLTGTKRYMYMAPESAQRQDHDREKFDKARDLAAAWPKLRRRVAADLRSTDPRVRQLATCAWLMERLALRVGTRQVEDDDDACARGLTTLRIGDLREEGPMRSLVLDFVGKDAVRYAREVRVSDSTADMAVLRHLRSRLVELKRGTASDVDPLFSLVNAPALNAYLEQRLKISRLTSKTLRTYRATCEYERAILRCIAHDNALRNARASSTYALALHEIALLRVAFLCNHRRATTGGIQELNDAQTEARLDALEQSSVAGGLTPAELRESARDISVKAQLSPSTSRANYIDPRVVVAYSLKAGLDIKRVYSAGLRRRFGWAIMQPGGYRFCT